MDGFNSGFGGGGFMFTIFPIIFFIIFALVIGTFIVVIVKGASQWNKNNHSPVLTVSATIVSRRMDVSHGHVSHDNTSHVSSSSSYYITFQVESGDRMEFLVPDAEYGLLVEGDIGKLTFQGTRYKGFIRER